jgi:hypothetical protein
MRALLFALAACTLFELAGAQTPTPVSKTADATTATSPPSSEAAAPPTEKAAETTTIAVSVSLPTVHVLGSGVPPETLKAARDAGYAIKVANGSTHFCKNEAEIGSRFKKETCINEDQLYLVLHRSEEQRERLNSLKGSSAISH